MTTVTAVMIRFTDFWLGIALEEMEKPVSKILTQLQDLKKQAKERGFKGYSTLSKLDLQLLLAGKPVPKRMKKNRDPNGLSILHKLWTRGNNDAPLF